MISYNGDLNMRPYIKNVGECSYVYKLKSVLEHWGNSYCGHYVAMKRLDWGSKASLKGEKEIPGGSYPWVLADDESTSFKDSYDSLQMEAYMLFYERDNSS